MTPCARAIDRVIDGPKPELLRPVLDALSDPLPTPEEEERMVRGALARLDARLSSPSRDASGPILLDDADVQSAPPTPGAPALQKEEKAPDPPPPVTAGGTPALPAPRTPAFLADTSRSPEAEAAVHEALVAVGLRPARPAPTVRVVGAAESPRTVELPVMDPSQGARRPPPELTLQDYVAYRTELELWPAGSVDIHRRYTLSMPYRPRCGSKTMACCSSGPPLSPAAVAVTRYRGVLTRLSKSLARVT